MNNNIDLSNVPHSPGCYLWKDKNDVVIYVGKSNNLKNRMKSYFNNNQTLKNSLLVKRIYSFEYIVTKNNQESFLLETKLIHKYEPKYNVKVKFSGYSPYIVFSGEKEKLLSIKHKISNNKNQIVYGPFPSEFSPYKIVQILKEIFPINKCLNPGKGIPCIYHQMGKCLGHCIRKVDQVEYDIVISRINDFFKGKIAFVENSLQEKMLGYSESLNFEQAMDFKKMIDLIQKYKDSEQLIFPNHLNADIFSWYIKEDYLSISVTYIRMGRFSLTENFITKIYDSVEESLESFISLFYLEKQKPKILILMDYLQNLESLYNIEIPKKGLKKTYLDQTKDDAIKRLENEFNILKIKDQKYNDLISAIKLNINISEANSFELVDISSLQGESQVGAVVAFKDGNKDKKMYRKYIIDSIDYQDDYKSMEEVIYRHFRSKLLKNIPFPNVFIVDGGKGQINIAKKVFESLKIEEKTKLISLKKNNKHKTKSILFYDQNNELKELDILDNNSFKGVYEFFMMMQDEVHRFVIDFNRHKRKEKLFENSLNQVDFLNDKNVKDLFDNFQTLHQIANANQFELEQIIGKKKTLQLIDYFKTKESD